MYKQINIASRISRFDITSKLCKLFAYDTGVRQLYYIILNTLHILIADTKIYRL